MRGCAIGRSDPMACEWRGAAHVECGGERSELPLSATCTKAVAGATALHMRCSGVVYASRQMRQALRPAAVAVSWLAKLRSDAAGTRATEMQSGVW